MIETDELDSRIERALGTKPCTTTEVASVLRLSRSTARSRLVRLQARKRVTSRKASRSRDIVWSRAYPHVEGKRSIEVYEGAQYYRVFTALWKLPKGSVMYTLQSKRAAHEEAITWPRDFIVRAQESIKKRDLLIRSMVHKNIFNLADVFEERALRAHAGRKIGMKMLADEAGFDGYGEYVVAKECLLLVNPKQRRAILVRDKEIVHVAFQLMRLLYDLVDMPDLLAEVVDPNAFVMKKLERLKGTRHA